jgi:hypothetical protein
MQITLNKKLPLTVRCLNVCSVGLRLCLQPFLISSCMHSCSFEKLTERGGEREKERERDATKREEKRADGNEKSSDSVTPHSY